MPNAQRPLPRVGDVLAGKYQIDSLIGVGAIGAVFSATHRTTGKRSAVKCLLPKLSDDPEAIDRFVREALIVGRINHPNVVRVYDAGQADGLFYLVMELLQGETLGYRLASQGALSAPVACRLMEAILWGVSAAHAAGVIHRDLKPDNIFICSTHDGEEQLKILDFGVARMRTLHGEARKFRTRENAIMGTPYYLAPEQVKATTVDARTDIYALGVIMYQMLSDRLPFDKEQLPDLLDAIVNTSPPPLTKLMPSVPAQVARSVETAMARDPMLRFSSAREFALELQQYGGFREVVVVATNTDRQTIEHRQLYSPPVRTAIAVAQRRSAKWSGAILVALTTLVLAVIVTRSASLGPETKRLQGNAHDVQTFPAPVVVKPGNGHGAGALKLNDDGPALSAFGGSAQPVPMHSITVSAPSSWKRKDATHAGVGQSLHSVVDKHRVGTSPGPQSSLRHIPVSDANRVESAPIAVQTHRGLWLSESDF